MHSEDGLVVFRGKVPVKGLKSKEALASQSGQDKWKITQVKKRGCSFDEATQTIIFT
jgi:hypothetical protein